MKTKYKFITIPKFMIVCYWLSFDSTYMFDLHKKLSISYSHLHALKKNLVDKKLIEIIDMGREIQMKLTPKGYECAKTTKKLLEFLNISDDKLMFKTRRKILYSKDELEELKQKVNL